MGLNPQGRPLAGKTAIVCGGSKGIGRATAAEFARLGASVGLVARDACTLADTSAMLESMSPDGAFVETIACDATRDDLLNPLLDDFVARRGAPDYLVNLVGAARPQYAEQLRLDDFRAAMDTNYLGQLVPVLALLPHFLQRGDGHIALTSSALGFMGVMGYATYAPTKYAVVGLAEVLRHEFAPRGLRFSVLFPPDTDTPGFAVENETKPPEWFATQASKLMSAEEVAAAFVNGIRKGRFYITPGQSAMLWRLARYTPRLLHWYTDRELANARRRLGKA